MKQLFFSACLLVLLAACDSSQPPIAGDQEGTPPSAQGLQIWFVRHAESEINVLDEHSEVVKDEGVTYPLTGKGIQQAVTLGEKLADKPITAIYSSTRLRTLQTADAIAFQHNIPLRLAPGAVEVDFGIEHATGEAFYHALMGIMQRWAAGADRDDRLASGESFNELESRFMPFWQNLVGEHRSDTGIIAVVTHGAVMMLMLPEICADTLTADTTLRHQPHNTGIVKGELRDGVLHCTQWMDIKLSR